MMTDPIADMLTRIRNAVAIYRPYTVIPNSKIKEAIAAILKREGFIQDYKVEEDDIQGILKVYLKYGPDGEQVIRNIQRVSKPGRRVYCRLKDMKKVLGGLGISIVSTSQGILTDRECREKRIGGEILCTIW